MWEMTSLSWSLQEAALLLKLKGKFIKGEVWSEVVILSGETIGIINVSEEFNWCSLMRYCGCCVLSGNCHPPAQGSLTKVRSSQAVKFSTGA